MYLSAFRIGTAMLQFQGGVIHDNADATQARGCKIPIDGARGCIGMFGNGCEYTPCDSLDVTNPNMLP